MYCFFFFFNDTATTEIYTLSLHDALPISYALYIVPSENGVSKLAFSSNFAKWGIPVDEKHDVGRNSRSEEHTSELQSPCNLVCRLLLEKKKNNPYVA